MNLNNYVWGKELEHSSYKKEVFCDMDGVLADFEPALVNYFNEFLAAYYSFSVDRVNHFYREANIVSDWEKNKYSLLVDHVIEELGRSYVRDSDLDSKFKTCDTLPYTEKWYDGTISGLSFVTYRLVYNNYTFWNSIKWTDYGRHIWKAIVKGSSIDGYDFRILTTPMLKLGAGHGCFLGKQNWVHDKLGQDVSVIFEKNKEKYAHKNAILIDDSETKCNKFIKAGGKAIHISPSFFDHEEFDDELEQATRRDVVINPPAHVTDIVLDNKNSPVYEKEND